MNEDMNARKLGTASQRSQFYSCRLPAACLKRSPDTATPGKVWLFQRSVIESGHSICNRNQIMTGLKFLFQVMLQRLDLVHEIYHLGKAEPVSHDPGHIASLAKRFLGA
jgi:integrase/recombinase XerD